MMDTNNAERKEAIRIILLSNWGMQIPEVVFDEVLNALETPDTCPVLGIKLDYDSVDDDYYSDDDSATVIMFDKNERDFNADNLMVMSNKAKKALMGFSPDDLEKLSKFLRVKISQLMLIKLARLEELLKDSI